MDSPYRPTPNSGCELVQGAADRLPHTGAACTGVGWERRSIEQSGPSPCRWPSPSKRTEGRAPAVPSGRYTLASAYRQLGLDGRCRGLAVRETVPLCVSNAAFIRDSTAGQKCADGGDNQVHGFQGGLRSPKTTADVFLGCAKA
jgi:hypothetical protein